MGLRKKILGVRLSSLFELPFRRRIKNGIGTAFYLTGITTRDRSVSSSDAYKYLQHLKRINEPKRGCLIAFKDEKVLPNEPDKYRHMAVALSANPTRMVHRYHFDTKLKKEFLGVFLLRKGFRRVEREYYEPAPMYETEN